MKSKICIIAPSIPPSFAGADKRMLNQAKYIASRGYEITLITNTTDHNETYHNLKIKVVKVPHWYSMSVRDSNWTIYLRKIFYLPVIFFKLYKLIKRKKFKIVHIVKSQAGLPLYAILIAKIKGIKIINNVTLYGEDDPEAIGKQNFGKLKKSIYFNLPDAIVVNSPLLEEACLSANIPRNKLNMIPNPVNTSIFKPENSIDKKISLKNKLGLDKYQWIFLTVSILEPRKNIEELIDIYYEIHKYLPNSRFLIVGPTDTNNEVITYYKSIVKLIDQYNLNSNIQFLNHVNDVNQWMKISDFFLFASIREGMPNALLEAMSSGMIIIVKEIKHLTDIIIRDHENGIIYKEKNKTAKEIIEITKNQEILENFKIQARQTAIKKFDTNVIMKEYISLYKKISDKVFS